MSSGVIFCSALWGALVFAPVAVLAQRGPEQSPSASAAAASSAQESGLYENGMRALTDGRWLDAEAIFTKIATQHGEHFDGALYWKAYAQNKQGQGNAALGTCAELRRDLYTSDWVHECGALEIEIQAKAGKPVEPKTWSDDDLKLLALASLMQKDEAGALAQLQEILNGDASEQLKKKAMFILGQHYSDATYAQIVRISYVEGDVRIARGEQNEKPAGEAWEEAVADLPLETGFSLVTGNGRAEIELEDASTIYLGENSVLTFNDLHTTSGVPYTEVALLSGTVSLAIKPYIYGETFVLRTPMEYFASSHPHSTFARITSYVDATTITSQESEALVFPKLGGKALAKGQMMTLREGRLIGMGPDDSTAFAEWDKWVADRVAQRTAAMADVMKAAGLASPLPGLAGMQGQGTFFACAPYGTCWEPATANDGQQSASNLSRSRSASAAGGGQPAHVMQASFVSSLRFREAQLMPTASPAPFDPSYWGAFSPCFPSAVRYRVQKDPITGKARVVSSGIGGNAVPWGWAVCHAGGWIYRRHHYVWCASPKRHHLEPVRWVKSAHKVGFVPIHPYDVKGRPPINRKEQVFAVNNKNGLSLERVKFDPGHTINVLKSPPREFRNAYLHPLARADAPRMEAHAMKEPFPGDKGVRAMNVPIRFESKSQTFMVSKEVTHGGKSVTVSTPISNRAGNLQAWGGNFAGGHGAFNGGNSSRAGGGTGGSGGGSHGGGSSGGGSHGGGGSGSSGGGSHGGGGSGSSGGGSHGGGSSGSAGSSGGSSAGGGGGGHR